VLSLLVIAEHTRGGWHRMTALAAQQLGEALAWPVDAAAAGSGFPLMGDLAGRRLRRAIAVEHPLLENYTADGYTAALEGLIRETEPRLVLFPHTYQVRDFAPKLAARFGRSL
jgi:electron transfer flavoprotein alpha subunit